MYSVYIWPVAIVTFFIAIVLTDAAETSVDDTNPSVALLQDYLRINTTTYNDLTPAVNFWKARAAEQNVTMNEYVYVTGMPVLVLKWPGSNSELSSIMLNSHMDVVPANEGDGWIHPPFDGVISDGKIYGRGSQDMKSVSIQYYEALKRLKAKNVTLLRDVYMTLMPDEEVGAEAGMQRFLESAEFKAMNVGFEMDEGGALNSSVVPCFYQDKVVWQIRVDCHGVAGHGSSFPPTNTTAVGRCYDVMTNMFKFREEEYLDYIAAPASDYGVYTSSNLNILSGGTANNVIPSVVSLIYDIRLDTSLKESEFQEKLENIIYSAGDNITITYLSKNPQSPATVANSSNPYFVAVAKAGQDLNIPVLAAVPPASTDARHVRLAGVPALGLSPQMNTPGLMHGVNEYLELDTFSKGIDYYEKAIYNLANVPADQATNPKNFLYSTTI